jgi:hypothetical protein
MPRRSVQSSRNVDMSRLSEGDDCGCVRVASGLPDVGRCLYGVESSVAKPLLVDAQPDDARPTTLIFDEDEPGLGSMATESEVMEVPDLRGDQ